MINEIIYFFDDLTTKIKIILIDLLDLISIYDLFSQRQIEIIQSNLLTLT